MCGLMGSYDISKLEELYVDNVRSGRGTVAYSVSRYLPNGRVQHLIERSGEYLDINLVKQYQFKGAYYILHSLAPTTKTINYHPATHNSRERTSMLWHNGIIKANETRRLQTRHVRDTGTNVYNISWDTELLLLELDRTNTLDDIDGSFACFYYNTEQNRLNYFRNDLANLYRDEHGNISTESFEGAVLIEPNHFFYLNGDLDYTLGITGGTFKPHYSPYFVG
jgi:hypothetical protein